MCIEFINDDLSLIKVTLCFHDGHINIHTYIHAVCLCVDRDFQNGRGVQSWGGGLCYPVLTVIVVI